MQAEGRIMRNGSLVIQNESSHLARPPSPVVFPSFRQFSVMTPKGVASPSISSDGSIMKSTKQMESHSQSLLLPAGPAFLTGVKTAVRPDHMQVFLRTTPTMSDIPKSPYILRPYHQPLPNIGQQKMPEEDEISILQGTEESTSPPPSYSSSKVRTSSWVNQLNKNESNEFPGDSQTNEKETRATAIKMESLDEEEGEKIHTNEKQARPESAKSLKTDPEAKLDGESGNDSSEVDCNKLVEEMGNKDIDVRLRATIKARRKVSFVHSTEMEKLMEAGILEPAVESLQMENTDLQYEALWILTNIASGNSQDTTAVVEKGCVPLFVSLLRSSDVKIREQAVWAIGNIAGESYDYRNLILIEGVLEPLMDLLTDDPSQSLLGNIAWLLSNLTRHKPIDQSKEDLDMMLKMLKILLENTCHDIQGDTLWALSYITDGPNEGIQLVIDNGFCPRLVDLMKSEVVKVSKAALRTCGNIATGTDAQTDAILNENALEVVKPMLTTDNTSVRKEICWLISNVTAGTKEQIQRVIDNGLVELMVQAVSEGPYEVSKEAVWALSNLSMGGDSDQIIAMTQAGGVKALSYILDNSVDGPLLEVTLEGISHVLNTIEGHSDYELVKATVVENEGISLLETHSQSQVETVNTTASNILDRHFHENNNRASAGDNDNEKLEEEKEEEEKQGEEEEEEQKHEGEEEEETTTAITPEKDDSSEMSRKLSSHALKYTT